MLLKYEKNYVSAYLMLGILEEPKITDEMKQELSIINDLINALRNELALFCAKSGVKSAKDLMIKAKEDKALNEQVEIWMKDVFEKKSANIISITNKFNLTFSEGYKEFLESQQATQTQAG